MTRRCTAVARCRTTRRTGPTRPSRSSAATTTAASCGSARTARSTCRSATPAVAGRRRTCSTARSPATRHPATTSSAARTSPTAHLTGVILRLNPDGTAPRDNPFYRLGAERGGQVGANLKKIYAYGLRNGFGMAFDPFSGELWEQENGDDSFSEINRTFEPASTRAGRRSWARSTASHSSRRSRRRAAPVPPDPAAPAGYYGLQQIALDAGQHRRHAAARRSERLFKLPGSRFSDPEMTWKYEVAPGGIDFLSSRELGRDYRGDLFVGSARRVPARRQHLPARHRRQPPRGRRRGPAPARQGRRQRRQVRHHRERVAALGHELRRHARPAREPRRARCTSCPQHAGRRLRDHAQVAPVRTPPGPARAARRRYRFLERATSPDGGTLSERGHRVRPAAGAIGRAGRD